MGDLLRGVLTGVNKEAKSASLKSALRKSPEYIKELRHLNSFKTALRK